jgi:hypothetical protein
LEKKIYLNLFQKKIAPNAPKFYRLTSGQIITFKLWGKIENAPTILIILKNKNSIHCLMV